MNTAGMANISNGLKSLYQKMRADDQLTSTELGATNRVPGKLRGIHKRPHAGLLEFNTPSDALTLIALACERGYIAEVIEIFTNAQSSPNIVLLASIAFPDLSGIEVGMLLKTQYARKATNQRPLDVDLIRELITTSRAPYV